jgi:hypothetical protein
MDGSDLLGASAGIAASRPCSWQGRDYSGCNHAGCSPGSSLHELIQQTGNKPVERVDYVGKMRLLSRASIQGRGGTRYVEKLDGAEGSVRN